MSGVLLFALGVLAVQFPEAEAHPVAVAAIVGGFLLTVALDIIRLFK